MYDNFDIFILNCTSCYDGFLSIQLLNICFVYPSIYIRTMSHALNFQSISHTFTQISFIFFMISLLDRWVSSITRQQKNRQNINHYFFLLFAIFHIWDKDQKNLSYVSEKSYADGFLRMCFCLGRYIFFFCDLIFDEAIVHFLLKMLCIRLSFYLWLDIFICFLMNCQSIL